VSSELRPIFQQFNPPVDLVGDPDVSRRQVQRKTKRAFYLGPNIVVKHLLQHREPHLSALLILLAKLKRSPEVRNEFGKRKCVAKADNLLELWRDWKLFRCCG
jgi:hypothetical protein